MDEPVQEPPKPKRGRKAYPRDADGNKIRPPGAKLHWKQRGRRPRPPGRTPRLKIMDAVDAQIAGATPDETFVEAQADAPAEPQKQVPLALTYEARPQFVSFHKRKRKANHRFACLVCHRRLGKTTACIHDLLDDSIRNTFTDGSLYAYVAPELKQAKNVAWEKLCQAVEPLRIAGRAQVRISDLSVRIPATPAGGRDAVIRIYGADNPDALRGIRLDGIVLDEYADMDPGIVPVIMPALADRRGWLTYIGTPRGHNAFYGVYKEALAKPDQWFSMLVKASQSGVLSDEELDVQRDRLLPEEYAQEYECSFEAAVVGAYYGRAMADAEEDGRITGVPAEQNLRVWVSWDLGFTDSTALWFVQVVGREIHVIDYYEASGFDLRHFVKIIQQKPYLYHSHILPHDAFHTEIGTGKTKVETLQSLELPGDIVKAPNIRVDDGINAVRMLLPKCYFDRVKTARGVEALKLYRAQTNPKGADPTQHQVLRPRPVHDWTSHAADSFRYLATTLDEQPALRNIQNPRGSFYRGEGGWMG